MTVPWFLPYKHMWLLGPDEWPPNPTDLPIPSESALQPLLFAGLGRPSPAGVWLMQAFLLAAPSAVYVVLFSLYSHVACGTCLLQPGIEPMPLAHGMRGLPSSSMISINYI